MDTEPLVVERTYNAPVSQVWQALTDQNKMTQWYFEMEDFTPEVGFEFQFYGESDDGQYLHFCKVTEVINSKKIAYTWRYADFPGNSELSFELFEDGNKTRLLLTHAGLETFSANNPDFTKESFTGGWNYLINTSLPEFLEKEKTAI